MTATLDRPAYLSEPQSCIPCEVTLGWLPAHKWLDHPADYLVTMSCGCMGGMCRLAYYSLDCRINDAAMSRVGMAIICGWCDVAGITIASARPLKH